MSFLNPSNLRKKKFLILFSSIFSKSNVEGEKLASEKNLNKLDSYFFCKITNPYFLGRQKGEVGEEGKITKIKRETLATFFFADKRGLLSSIFNAT